MERMARRAIMATIATIAAAQFMACANVPAADQSAGAVSGPRFELNLEPGADSAKPQVAAWVEDDEGRYLGTIYVTGKGARGAWTMAPAAGRPEALPVWKAASGGGSDAVSSATAKGATAYGSSLAAGLRPGSYVIMLEVNRSFDYNDAYPESLGVNGQPSVVYEARLTVGGERAEATFAPVGTGSVDGADGYVRPGLDGIGTALRLFSSMTVSYETN